MKSKRTLHCAIAGIAIAGLTILASGWVPQAQARTNLYGERYAPYRQQSAPVMAIVGLSEQRVTIYNATGKILEAPVSSGATGYETPPGIYSIVQKEEDHHSNLYDDASMPYMERITWTGIALHAGELPGRPASHGCVRLPHEFAEQLYELTNLGMRVLIMREAVAPVDFAQPAMFNSPRASSETKGGSPSIIERSSLDGTSTDSMSYQLRLKELATRKSFEAESAATQEKEARRAAARSAAEAARVLRVLRGAEASLAKAEADLKGSEKALETAQPARAAQAEAAKAQALAKVESAKAQLETVRAQSKSTTDAVAQAEEEARAAAAALASANAMVDEANQNMSPVSVFVSRKTRRLYIRKGNQPVFESPVMIREADKTIGSFVFTAVDGTPGALRWNVVSMYKNPTNIEPYAPAERRGPNTRTEPPRTDASAAQAALDRLTIPQEALDRISQTVLPGSSLIISDEGPSIETGKDTDFVVFMSGEPQGGIAIRHRNIASRNDGYEYSSFSELFGGRDRYRGRDQYRGRDTYRGSEPSRGGFPNFFSR